jgi:CRP-like cAMP-binding protein
MIVEEIVPAVVAERASHFGQAHDLSKENRGEVAVYAHGSVIEMATIDREGCAGMQALFGAKASSVRLLVQIPGSVAKMSRAAFVRAMASMPSFRNLMSAYIHAVLEQVLVSVACNGAHSLKERLARWLLMMRDRGDEDTLRITQRGPEGKAFMRNAHSDIPVAVDAMRQYWMPIRYRRDA